MPFPCFMLEPTGAYRCYLRRYTNGPCGDKHYHDASVCIGDVPERPEGAMSSSHSHDDPRWPVMCKCGYIFADSDNWQLFTEKLYRRGDTGAITTLDAAPAGAIFNAEWLTDVPEWTGPDGKSLHCKLPNGNSWSIDSRASNCDSPCTKCSKPYHAHKWGRCDENVQGVQYADARPHKCWVRHGEPPNLHVDKNGVTCNAGAGSILSGNYHGFLHNGQLTDG